MTGKQTIFLTPIVLDFGDRLLIALQAIMDRLEQGLEVAPCDFLGLAKALIGALEERLLRFGEQFIAHFGKASFESLQLLLMSAIAFVLRRPERSQLLRSAAIRIPFPHHLVELKAKVADGLPGTGCVAAREKPTDQRTQSKRNQADYDNDRLHGTSPHRNRR